MLLQFLIGDFLRIMKSLQLRGRRKIAESRKYCLVCDYFFLAYIFLYFCISQVWEFRTYSHHITFLNIWK